MTFFLPIHNDFEYKSDVQPFHTDAFWAFWHDRCSKNMPNNRYAAASQGNLHSIACVEIVLTLENSRCSVSCQNWTHGHRQYVLDMWQICCILFSWDCTCKPLSGVGKHVKDFSQFGKTVICLKTESTQIFVDLSHCRPLAMANCACCNNLGSSSKFQLLLTLSTGILFILLGIYGITLILLVNFKVTPSSYDDLEGLRKFSGTASDLASWVGLLVTHPPKRSYFPEMWVKQCHFYIFLPPMTGNGKFIPPVKWYWGMVYYCFTHSLIYLRPRHSISWHWNIAFICFLLAASQVSLKGESVVVDGSQFSLLRTLLLPFGWCWMPLRSLQDLPFLGRALFRWRLNSLDGVSGIFSSRCAFGT